MQYCTTTTFYNNVLAVGGSYDSGETKICMVGIQADKSGYQDHNASLFNHSNTVNMSVDLNSTKCLFLDANANFTKAQFSQCLHVIIMELTLPLMCDSGVIHPLAYKELTPLFVFNNQGIVGITVEMQFSSNVGANTKAYALVSDRRLKLHSDGKKMNVLY